MTLFKKFLVLTASLLCAMLLGCGTSGEESETRPAPDSMSPAEYYDQTHQGMPTPSGGKYVPGTATDTDGAIQFETADGSVFEIEATRSGDGYHYGETRRLK